MEVIECQLWVGFQDREPKGYGCALSLNTARSNAPAVGNYQTACDRQSQTAPPFATPACLVYPVKTLKYKRKVFGGDPRTLIGDPAGYLVCIPVKRHPHLTTRR